METSFRIPEECFPRDPRRMATRGGQRPCQAGSRPADAVAVAARNDDRPELQYRAVFGSHCVRRIDAGNARSVRQKPHSVRPTRNADPLAYGRQKAVVSARAAFRAGMVEYRRPPSEGHNRSRLLKKDRVGSAWWMTGDAGHRRMRRVSGRRGLPGQQLEVVCRGSHGELLSCSGEASQLERS